MLVVEGRRQDAADAWVKIRILPEHVAGKDKAGRTGKLWSNNLNNEPNYVFVTIFLIPISLQEDGVNLWHFKLRYMIIWSHQMSKVEIS